jgi:hypothetical protein
MFKILTLMMNHNCSSTHTQNLSLIFGPVRRSFDVGDSTGNYVDVVSTLANDAPIDIQDQRTRCDKRLCDVNFHPMQICWVKLTKEEALLTDYDVMYNRDDRYFPFIPIFCIKKVSTVIPRISIIGVDR